ncbi:MAG: transcriptional repressor [Dermatophilus congolensis]|nr:transcriptional repressor [Dermatophilus congolensis]
MTEPRRRTTRQQTAIEAALRGAEEFVSAQAVHLRLRAEGERIGLATVYRTLGRMCEDGHLDVVRNAEGESLYRFCESEAHHHHLVCRRCGHAVEVNGPAAVESWVNTVSARHGFTEISHTIELFGMCAACSASSSEGGPEAELSQS